MAPGHMSQSARRSVKHLPASASAAATGAARPADAAAAARAAAKEAKLRGQVKRRLERAEVAGSEFFRGHGNSEKAIDRVRNPKIRGQLKEAEKLAFDSTLLSKRAQEVLLPSAAGGLTAQGMAKTWQFRQADVVANVQEGAKKKHFALSMPEFGPYACDYTRNGKYLLLGGRKGHLALFDWHSFKLKTEIHVRETVRDVQILHNETMFAVAQKKYVHIYDDTGMEIHVLRHQLEVNRLGFLPYHYLLTSVSKLGTLRYQDTSTGAIVAEHRTRLGDCNVLEHNPSNAIVHLGHTNGSVTLWAPTVSTPLVKLQCHNAPVTALTVDRGGRHMVTAGLDGAVKVWDLRMYKELHSYATARPASTMDLSQSGLLAFGYGPHVQVWRDALNTKQPGPYLYEPFSGTPVKEVRFCPYEDVLGVGHSEGFTSLLVPGAGEANFDTFEANPFESTKQRREKTVKSLLEKLQPDMITLDKGAFTVATEDEAAAAQADADKRAKEAALPKVDLEKTRRRDSDAKKVQRKQLVAQASKRELHREAVLAQAAAAKEAAKAEAERMEKEGIVAGTLDRFKRR